MSGQCSRPPQRRPANARYERELSLAEIREEPVDAERDQARRRESDAEHAHRPPEPRRAAAPGPAEAHVVVAERLPRENDRNRAECHPDGDREAGVHQVVRVRVPRPENRERHRGEGEQADEDRDDRAGVPCRRRVGARRCAGAHYCFRYGRPTAAGGIERPITPATAMSVRTYGSAVNSVATEPEYSGSRWASAVENPNSRHAAAAPNGRQFPKIRAASAMNPRPEVMFSVNELTKPIER